MVRDNRFARAEWPGPALVALATCLAVLCELDAAGDYPRLREGPGLTVDESFNVQEGVRLVHVIPEWIAGGLTLREAFGDAAQGGPVPPAGWHNPDHPPLGRIAIGLAHETARALAPPADHESPFITDCARTASAVEFALTIFLVGFVAGRWYGRGAGLCAAVSIALMPRLYGHAHLAALETPVGLAYAAAVLAIAAAWDADHAPKSGTAAWTGALWGLALLTKIQAVLIPLPVVLWALFHFRRRAIRPLLIWFACGLAVFVAGWPWLWLDLPGHAWEYFARTAARARLSVWYFGTKYADRDVPWHYPFVMFLTTVPLGLHLLGLLGCREEDSVVKHRREQLLLACIAFPLLVFAIPGAAVYDGVRLFAVVFPLGAVFIGRGGRRLFDLLRFRASARVATLATAAFVLLQGVGLLLLSPCYLSYYNAAAGGLPGAARLGLDTTYWGDSLTRSLLARTCDSLPEGTTVEVVPLLHDFYLGELQQQSPILRNSGLKFTPWQGDDVDRTRYVLVFFRRADLPPRLMEWTDRTVPLESVERQGVVLAGLYRLEPE